MKQFILENLLYLNFSSLPARRQISALKNSLLFLQTLNGKSGWINLGENATELIECDTGEKLLKEWKLFRYCTDPFMIQCLETACIQGKLMLHNFSHSCKSSLKYSVIVSGLA